MSHMIDHSKGRAAFAFAGQPAWHNLGTQLLPTDSPEEQLRKAGLDYSVLEAETMFRRLLKRGENGAPDEFEIVPFAGKKTLYRSDNGAPLSVMSDDYHPHQPRQIFALYQEIARVTGFALETAGGLDDGKRIWALLRVNEGADIVNADRVRPYILLATSYDGSMATIAKFTAVRVVCHNTISMSVGHMGRDGKVAEGTAERDDARAGREQVVRVLHSTKWTDEVAKRVRMTLGIAADAFERFTIEARALAGISMSEEEADAFVVDLLEPYFRPSTAARARVKNIRDTKGYRRIMALFQGEAAGADLVGKDRWAMLNAVTQFVDHERGLSDSSRVEQAWFGFGEKLKNQAFEVLRRPAREAVTIEAEEKLAA